MEIEKIKDLIVSYEWIVEEPNPSYPQYILDCLYLLFLYKTERNEVYLNSKSVESFKPNIEELKQIFNKNKDSHCSLGKDIAEALQELLFFLEREEDYISNDSLIKRFNIMR